MFRYVALTWSPANPSSTDLAASIAARLLAHCPTWTRTLEAPGLLVLHIDAPEGGASTPHLLDPRSGTGVVLGTLFDKRYTKLVGPLGLEESSVVVATRGRALITDYWGRYVAFIHLPDSGGSICVIRDPTAGLPCYVATLENIRTFFSFAPDVSQLGLLAASINWRFIAAHLRQPRLLHCTETALEGIEEIHPGECYEVRATGTHSRSLYWTPLTIARTERIADPSEAVTRTRETVRACAAAWASCYPRILHLLSGGLDSSIILHCMEGSSSIAALTFFNTFSPQSDERHFARLVAEQARTELIEIEEDPSRVNLEILLNAHASVRPWDTQYHQTHGSIEHQVARDTGARAVFSGHGGDHLFLQGPLWIAAADYAKDYGISRALLRMCARIASAEQSSFWSVLGSSLSYGLGWQRWCPQKNIRRIQLITPQTAAFARESGLLNPIWLRETDVIGKSRMPWGKLEHARITSVRQDFYTPFGPSDSPERVAPFIQQPIVELSLRVPTYVLTYDAYDRFIERQAFRGALPDSLLWRRAKGSAMAFLQRLLPHTLPFARELMLDGELISRGYLDRARVERALSSTHSALSMEAAEIIVFHLSTEAFLQAVRRHWQATSPGPP